MRFPFPSREQAAKACTIARRIHPDRHWYITCERGPWEVVQSEHYNA